MASAEAAGRAGEAGFSDGRAFVRFWADPGAGATLRRCGTALDCVTPAAALPQQAAGGGCTWSEEGLTARGP
ncbi:MAG: hypothetical protein RLZ97_2030 [Verrucomicrobiota bacterium]